jgi:hypothetical protein
LTFAGNVSLSAEPGDYDFGEYDLGHYSDEESDVDADALTLSAVVGIPLGPFTELYGKACIADVSAEINDDDFDASEALTRISHHPSRNKVRQDTPYRRLGNCSETSDRCIALPPERRTAASQQSYCGDAMPKSLSFFSILLIFTWNTSNLITK